MRRKGFTLIELVVVVGVLMLLGSLLIPAVAKAHRLAIRSRMKADLLVISTGLEAYRLDHRDYPRLSDNGPEIDGAALLCWALVAPGSADQDGADGPGFRLRGRQGQVYGPYIDPSRFRISGTDNLTAEIVDRNDRPIHYCPANPHTNINVPGGYVADFYAGPYGGPRPMYDHTYFEYCLDLKTMRAMLGDADNDGGIGAGETARYTGPFILWSAGPNGIFGPDPDHPVLNADGSVDIAHSASDDVTSFTP